MRKELVLRQLVESGRLAGLFDRLNQRGVLAVEMDRALFAALTLLLLLERDPRECRTPLAKEGSLGA